MFQGRSPLPLEVEQGNGGASRGQHLREALTKAVADQGFRLNFQPQWDARGKNLVGVEALIRWRHPELGNISPEEFIPLAEEMELIVNIGEWVLRAACIQYQIWQMEGLPPFLLGVNLSLQQLQRPNFVWTVRRILEETGMPPSQLQLEVTEGLIFRDLQHTIDVLRDLEQLGVRLAIDDFGTGYSSLSVLKNLPVHTLKIDKSFLEDLEMHQKAEFILESIIRLGQRLQLSVVAEGVETESQLQLLQSLQCDVLQGFFFSRPLNEEKITHYLHHCCNSGNSTNSTTAIAA
ncbi:diguanylate cyclase/phosphodiesterase (GGDEF & EAL domains) with PAS/PAC sensor(s) [Synechocystis sp. PCC 6714]|nr:diguanylate cyclase/phosphodiesterase (GGDEF & EAL domains) with PAS/PAC sensor(s) [Synechocystis sp. PCC 6714]